jgi:glutamyl/glutaminyl-tRNA synthetase
MTSDKVFNQDEKLKLTQIINEGMTVMQEVEDLTAGLNETVKAIAEEFEIKPGVLKKAIRTAHKGNFAEVSTDQDLLETILATVGRA